ncbi:MAG: winged helix-turn-helix transcriptional regulator, partial [Nitrososphaerota archaeon]|nr:winged helix-turn-helix transcriptional regulator [Nitrososphaerota archaeon]
MNETARRIYRYMYKAGKPLGIHELQRDLGLSSPSVASYHIKKLMEQGLVKEQEGGFVVDRVLFENMIRIRSSVIPFQTMYTVFFASPLVIMLTIFFPSSITAPYLFAVFVNVAALGFFLYETIKV